MQHPRLVEAIERTIAACRRHGSVWPRPPVVCTARLARKVRQVPLVRRGSRVRQVHKALKVKLVRKAPQERRVRPVHKGRRVTRAIQERRV